MTPSSLYTTKDVTIMIIKLVKLSIGITAISFPLNAHAALIDRGNGLIYDVASHVYSGVSPRWMR